MQNFLRPNGWRFTCIAAVQDRMIAGACYGTGEYFDVDLTLIRLLWVLFTLLGGEGILE